MIRYLSYCVDITECFPGTGKPWTMVYSIIIHSIILTYKEHVVFMSVHTMDELKLTGNALLGSRPILSFDKVSQVAFAQPGFSDWQLLSKIVKKILH